jgi:hypothetical protein
MSQSEIYEAQIPTPARPPTRPNMLSFFFLKAEQEKELGVT